MLSTVDRRMGRSLLRLSVVMLASGALLLSPTARAQYRTGDDGRALDANNRVGSGGYNSALDLTPRQLGVTGNQIVTGNVTGGKEFRGPVGYSSPYSFTGPVGGMRLDQFIRQSSGAPVGSSTPVDLTHSMPYYGVRTVTPPPGFVHEPSSGGYVPAPQPTARRSSELQFGQAPLVLPGSGQILLPSSISGSPAASALSGSNQFSGSTWPLSESPELWTVPGAGGYGTYDRFSPSAASLPPELSVQQAGIAMTAAQGPAAAFNARQNTAMTGEPSAVQSSAGALDQSVPPASLSSQTALPTGSADTAQYTRQYLRAGPELQSAQYAQLRQRLAQYNAERNKSDVELNSEYQALLEATRAAQAHAAQSPNAPQENPAGAAQQQRQQPRVPSAAVQVPKPRPLTVRSLAAGVDSKPLAAVLSKAEGLMHDGQFAAALEQYDAAQQLAPNNPLVLLGRAHAELGAGYYTSADSHIRLAVVADPAVLVGRYDLDSFLGIDRVRTIRQELQAAATTNPRQTVPLFLLAYIAYNTGQPAQAADDLQQLESRATGHHDPVVQTMRQIWDLPAASQSPPNK